MKTIILKTISLTNFKGIKSLTVDLDGRGTDILGANGTGKSTVFDAFVWLLFGKDSSDRKDFEIKTLDSDNNVIPKIDHEVSATLSINGDTVTIRRQFKEKWVKQRGSDHAEFTGNETAYFWNDVPMQQKDFQAKVSSVLDETIFKLITSPFAFDNLKWQDRRNVLMEISGAETDAQLVERMGDGEGVRLLREVIGSGKSVEEYRRQLESQIRIAKNDLKQFPTRIAEVQHNTPEAHDFDALRARLSEMEAELAGIDQALSDKSAAFDSVYEKRRGEQSAIHQAESRVAAIEAELRTEANRRSSQTDSETEGIARELSGKESELRQALAGIDTLKSTKGSLGSRLDAIGSQIQSKRNEWDAENAKEFSMPQESTCCPTCKRDFDPADIEANRAEAEGNFRKNKAEKLNSITAEGKSLAAEKDSVQKEIDIIDGRIDTGEKLKSALDTEISALKERLSTAAGNETEKPSAQEIFEALLKENSERTQKIAEIGKMKAEMTPEPVLDNAELKDRKAELVPIIDGLKGQIAVEVQIDAAGNRIDQLKGEESKLAQEIASMEKTLFTIDGFVKFKIEALERDVNGLFGFVKFKLFRQNINGGEEPCCEALIDGVPFSNANTASRINAGLDIINTLCRFYRVNAPIFIDNRESIIELIHTDSQVVNLIVSAKDKTLRVEGRKLEAVA